MVNSRRKGASGERELCQILFDELGIKCQRNLDQTRDGGADIRDIPGLAIEVKRSRSDSRGLHARWWKQARGQAAPNRLPVLAYREDYRDWRFIVGLGCDEFPCDVSLQRFCFEVRELLAEHDERLRLWQPDRQDA